MAKAVEQILAEIEREGDENFGRAFAAVVAAALWRAAVARQDLMPDEHAAQLKRADVEVARAAATLHACLRRGLLSQNT